MWLAIGSYHGPCRVHALFCYTRAFIADRARDKAYRVYVTDALRAQGMGQYLQQRFADLIEPREEIDVDRTIDSIIDRLGGE